MTSMFCPRGRTIKDDHILELRQLPGEPAQELRAGASSAPVPPEGEARLRVRLVHAKAMVVGLTDAAADLAEVLAAGGVYHA